MVLFKVSMKNVIKKFLFVFVCMFSVFGCSSKKVELYKNNTPVLDLRTYLSGKAKAWGMLEDRKGRITRRFVVEMNTTWNGNKGVLQEHFTFDDGEKSERIWTIEYTDSGNFTATAGDVVGKAIGKQAGNALQMKYTLDLKVGDKNYNVNLDDWMYLLDEKRLVNKSEIKKFGITFARLTIFFEKQ
jgi:Protein of unknown function (DUF3833)